MSEDTTGYDPEDEEDLPRHSTWKLEKFVAMFSSSFLVRLTVNDEPVGILHLRNEEDFKWLKARIDGVQTRRRKSDEFEKS